MLSAETIESIERMVTSGRYSVRGIAKLTGVSRFSVAAIARGNAQPVRRPKQEQTEAEGESPLSAGIAARCSTCGGLVYMPCRACHLREFLERQTREGRPVPKAEPCLDDEDQEEWARQSVAVLETVAG